jgi:hypothetical protein
MNTAKPQVNGEEIPVTKDTYGKKSWQENRKFTLA